MLCPSLPAYIVAALFAAGEPSIPALSAMPPAVTDSANAAMVEEVRAEVRAFYRDLDDKRWSAMLDHFLPAKVTARWAPPAATDTWVRLAAPPPVAGGGIARQCVPRATVAVVGDWARVWVRRCAEPPDEAWLRRVSGRWKIVHLDLSTSAGVTAASDSTIGGAGGGSRHNRKR